MFTGKTASIRFIFYNLIGGLLILTAFASRPEEARAFFASWELWREPILAGAICGLLASWLGVYVLLNRIVFISLGIAQGASFGIFLSFLIAAAFGYALHDSPLSLLAGMAVALGAALLFAGLRRGRRLPDESLIGFLYVAASGLTLLVGDRVAEGHHSIDDLLFGNAVAVGSTDLAILGGVAALLLLLHGAFRREFLYSSADPEFMAIRGLGSRFWTFFLYFTLTIGITFSLKTLGSLPVFALMVIPPFLSLKAAQGLRESFLISLLIGVWVPPLGYFFSYVFSFPTGASLIGVACLFALASFPEAWLTRRWRQR